MSIEETENAVNPFGTIDVEKDSFVLVKFIGQGSAMFQILPSNVSPAQLIMIGRVLQLQGEEKIREKQLRELMAEFKEEKPDILVAKGRVLKPNAK